LVATQFGFRRNKRLPAQKTGGLYKTRYQQFGKPANFAKALLFGRLRRDAYPDVNPKINWQIRRF